MPGMRRSRSSPARSSISRRTIAFGFGEPFADAALNPEAPQLI
jgi:hypothetical protein